MVSWLASARERLDDDHSVAAAWARMLWCLRFLGTGCGSFDGLNGKHRQCEQFAGARNVFGTLAAGEQAIVADAVESAQIKCTLV